ncbi:MAG: LysR family transcriptional regulator, partial [Mesorhizobium sp.]
AKNDPHNLGPGPVDADVMSRLPMILPARPHGLRVVLDHILGSAGIEPNIEVEVDAMPSTLRLVEAGIGYTI